MEAAHFGKLQVVRILLECGARVNEASKNGSTPLLLATQYGFCEDGRLVISALL